MRPTILNEALVRRLLWDLQPDLDENRPASPVLARAVLSYLATCAERDQNPDSRALKYLAQSIRRFTNMETPKDIGRRAAKAVGLLYQRKGHPSTPNKGHGLTESDVTEIALLVLEERAAEVARRRKIPLSKRPRGLGTPSEVAVATVAEQMDIPEDTVRLYAKEFAKELRSESKLVSYAFHFVDEPRPEE